MYSCPDPIMIPAPAAPSGRACWFAASRAKAGMKERMPR